MSSSLFDHDHGLLPSSCHDFLNLFWGKEEKGEERGEERREKGEKKG